MKELSIEQKAEAYDKALEKAQELYNNPNSSNIGKGYIYAVFPELNFPELKKLKDERIRKKLIRAFKSLNTIKVWNGIERTDILAWLEKQGTSYTKRDVDDAYLKGVTDTKNEIEKQYEANYQIRKDIATFIFNYKGDIKDRAKWIDYLGIKGSFVEKQSKQKHADKVEPKFQNGQWIVWQNKCYKVNYNGCGYELIDQNGLRTSLEYGTVNENAHIWDITKDAKDGDVLFHSDSASNGIFIFKEIIDKGFAKEIICYCDYDSEDHFCLGEHHTCCWADAKILYPATKEQRDLLFQKMKEAGYEWDAKKKELKRIKNEIEIPFGAKDSEFQEATYYIPKGFHAEIDDDKVIIKQGEQKNVVIIPKFRIGDEIKTTNEEPLTITKIDEKGYWSKDLFICDFNNADKWELVKQNPAWSEEDENIALSIEQVMNCASLLNIAPDIVPEKIDKIRTWLKSIRDRYVWKPSDEQLGVIEAVINNRSFQRRHLDSLYEQLKKLREE